MKVSVPSRHWKAKQQAVILCDFNEKIGILYQNNKETIPRGRRHLKRLAEKGKLCTVSGECNICEG